MQKILRSIIALALLFEAAAFLIGAMLHLEVPLPFPYAEVESRRFALLEAASGALLLVAFGATVLRKRNAWKIAVVSNVVGVASIAYVTAGGGGPASQSSHHQPMLILLIVVLVGLSIPRCRQALENGRHVRRRRRILQAF